MPILYMITQIHKWEFLKGLISIYEPIMEKIWEEILEKPHLGEIIKDYLPNRKDNCLIIQSGLQRK